MKFSSAFYSYNLCLAGDVGRTLATPSGGLNEHIPIVILNDQGGDVMNISEDATSTLRAQDHGHPPVICFQQNQREEVRNMGEQAGALTAEPGIHNNNYLCYAVDSHPMDSRFELEGDISPTVTSKLAKGSADGPLVLSVTNHDGIVIEEQTETLRSECHGAIPVMCFEPGIAKREGNGSRFVTEMCGTLRADMGDNQPAVCYEVPNE